MDDCHENHKASNINMPPWSTTVKAKPRGVFSHSENAGLRRTPMRSHRLRTNSHKTNTNTQSHVSRLFHDNSFCVQVWLTLTSVSAVPWYASVRNFPGRSRVGLTGTAGCGPACQVAWKGNPPGHPIRHAVPGLFALKRGFDDSDPLLKRVGGPVVIHFEGAWVIRARCAAKPVNPTLAGNPSKGDIEFLDHECGPGREIRSLRECRIIVHGVINAGDHRPRASGVRHGTAARSRCSLHPVC